MLLHGDQRIHQAAVLHVNEPVHQKEEVHLNGIALKVWYPQKSPNWSMTTIRDILSHLPK